MPTLYAGRPFGGVADMSPFGLKLKTWCRLKGLDPKYKGADLRKAPRGKLPYWEEDDGTVVCDSSEIIAHLTARHGGLPGDEGVDARTRGTRHAAQRLLEEHVYFAIIQFRWGRDEGARHVQQGLADILPPVIGGLVFHQVIRKGVMRSQRGQGIGRLTEAEIVDRIDHDFVALEALLGDDPWFGGDAPCTLDATAYAMLAAASRNPWDDALQARLRTHDRLMAYVERVHQQAWPDLDA